MTTPTSQRTSSILVPLLWCGVVLFLVLLAGGAAIAFAGGADEY